MGFVEPTKFTWVVDHGQRKKKPAKNTTWKARYTDPSMRDRSRTFARKADAERFLDDLSHSVRSGEWVDPKATRSRFDEWADTWWRTTVKLAPSTRRGYEKVLRLYVRPAFSGRKVTSIDWVEVELFATTLLESGLSPKTTREIVSVLSLILRTAQRARVIKENPAAGHSLPTGRKPATVLAMAQVDQLASAADDRYRAAIWLLALTGLRPSELCGLRRRDVDWERSTITVVEVQMWVQGALVIKGPKTASGRRMIPIPQWLLDDLATSIAAREHRTGMAVGDNDRIFASPEGKPMLDHTLWRIVDRARTRAGLPRIRPYDLRHSHASLLIDLGAHPKAISERMGHAEIGVTMNVYGQLFEGKQRELTDQLDTHLTRTRKPRANEEPTA